MVGKNLQEEKNALDAIPVFSQKSTEAVEKQGDALRSRGPERQRPLTVCSCGSIPKWE
jgi:hypothetical protein